MRFVAALPHAIFPARIPQPAVARGQRFDGLHGSLQSAACAHSGSVRLPKVLLPGLQPVLFALLQPEPKKMNTRQRSREQRKSWPVGQPCGTQWGVSQWKGPRCKQGKTFASNCCVVTQVITRRMGVNQHSETCASGCWCDLWCRQMRQICILLP